MTITAIPTVYRSIQFRSRLEARWAAFFDQCGWRWDYEPQDFDGYIPDFRIGHEWFEVKPTRQFDPEAAAKMERIGAMGCYVLADCPQRDPLLPFARVLGWRGPDYRLLAVFGCEREGEIIGRNGRPFLVQHLPNGLICQRHVPMDIPKIRFQEATLIDQLWAAAANATQWRGEQNHG